MISSMRRLHTFHFLIGWVESSLLTISWNGGSLRWLSSAVNAVKRGPDWIFWVYYRIPEIIRYNNHHYCYYNDDSTNISYDDNNYDNNKNDQNSRNGRMHEAGSFTWCRIDSRGTESAFGSVQKRDRRTPCILAYHLFHWTKGEGHMISWESRIHWLYLIIKADWAIHDIYMKGVLYIIWEYCRRRRIKGAKVVSLLSRSTVYKLNRNSEVFVMTSWLSSINTLSQQRPRVS